MANDTVVPVSLDDYFQTTPVGSIDRAIGNNLFGINHRQLPGLVPSNKDTYGLTFFVRPQLNMQADNIRNSRLFYPLLTENPKTIHRFIRCTLDPRIMTGYTFHDHKIPALKCPVVDNSQAFIPILTNTLNSLSGWQDIVAPTFTSKPGLYNEAYSQVDGIVRNFESFDIDATFRNTKGDPILYMFYIWLLYASQVFEGKLIPYVDFITENEIDYMTRIYRLVLDKEKQYVTKIAATGVAFPVSVPTGSFFDFSTEKPYNDQNKDITIRFRCLGVDYQDDILIKEFNKTVSIFNPDMRDGVRDATMKKVDRSALLLFNNRGYPRINPKDNELEWWVDTALAQRRIDDFTATESTGSVYDTEMDYTGTTQNSTQEDSDTESASFD